MIEAFKKQAVLDNGVSPNHKSEIINHKSSVASLIEHVFTESGLEKSLLAEGAEGKDAVENIERLISAAAVYDTANRKPLIGRLSPANLRYSATPTRTTQRPNASQ